MKFNRSHVITASTILALIACSLFIALSLNPAQMVSQVVMVQGKGAAANPAPPGYLRVNLFTNENPASPFRDPGNTFFPLAGKTINIVDEDNLSAIPETLVTNGQGFTVTSLSPANYSVTFTEQTMHVAIPVEVTRGNVSDLVVQIHVDIYHVLYSEVSAGNAQGDASGDRMYLLLNSQLPIANVNDTLSLRVREAGGIGYISNATVLAEQLEGSNLWVQVKTPNQISKQDVSNMALAVYSYSYSLSHRLPRAVGLS